MRGGRRMNAPVSCPASCSTRLKYSVMLWHPIATASFSEPFHPLMQAWVGRTDVMWA